MKPLIDRVVTQPELARRLGIRDAVIIGMGSMLGAGVFAAFSPAARVAGRRVVDRARRRRVGGVLQRHRLGSAGGAVSDVWRNLIYGRERLVPWWTLRAGGIGDRQDSQLCGDGADLCRVRRATGWWEKPIAVAAVIILATVNYYWGNPDCGLTG